MGRAARLKRERRMQMQQGTGSIEVVCPGMLEILSVGKGDIKLTIDGGDPGEVAKAKVMIEEMLAKGYGIFVEDAKGGLRRVKKFNPKKMAYVVSEVVENADAKPVGQRTREREVPVAGSRAKAIGRTSGG